jgi:hypothetical protein
LGEEEIRSDGGVNLDMIYLIYFKKLLEMPQCTPSQHNKKIKNKNLF